MPPAFVHLRLHTEYSLNDSVVRVPELIAAVAAGGMPAVAVTDEGNLFAMVKFYREALKAGVKPLIGVDLLVGEEAERQAPTRLTLLCQSQAGYRNLARLVSRTYLEWKGRGAPRLERSWLTRDGRPAHHLLDPGTGRPAFTGVVQATALAPTATEAEILAKAALLSGPEGAQKWLRHGGVLVFEDGTHRVI